MVSVHVNFHCSPLFWFKTVFVGCMNFVLLSFYLVYKLNTCSAHSVSSQSVDTLDSLDHCSEVVYICVHSTKMLRILSIICVHCVHCTDMCGILSIVCVHCLILHTSITNPVHNLCTLCSLHRSITYPVHNLCTSWALDKSTTNSVHTVCT
jgi:hypothetical protein